MKKMRLEDLTSFVTGSSQFRITESLNGNAPAYLLYSQTNLREDEQGGIQSDVGNKVIRTVDEVNTLSEGDILFSLISGIAVIVGISHEGYLYTQNYIKFVPNEKVDSKFLVYCLNENKKVRRQLQTGLQGSTVMKYTLRQLKKIDLPTLPVVSRQKEIGDIYFKQIRLNMLRNRVANLEKIKTLHLLEEEMKK